MTMAAGLVALLLLAGCFVGRITNRPLRRGGVHPSTISLDGSDQLAQPRAQIRRSLDYINHTYGD